MMMQNIRRFREYVLCAHRLGRNLSERWSVFWKLTKNFRVRLGLASYHPTTRYTLQTVYGPLHFRDNFGDVTNLISLYYRKVYRPGRLKQDGVVFDIGANIGLAAALFAYYNPGRRIFCFEPLAANAAMVALNCPGARVEQLALGARSGQVTLQVDEDQVMASSISCNWQTKTEVFDTISLDDYAAKHNLDRVALMKIDVEGMELDILKGAKRTLAHTHEIVLETHGFDRHEEVKRCLQDAGFFIGEDTFDGDTGLVHASRSVENHELVSSEPFLEKVKT